MPELSPELLQKLCELARRLRQENADFLEHPEDDQRWYNRGYANGMLKTLQQVLREQAPCGESPDDESELVAHQVMAWGKAYRHGEQMGLQETCEVTGVDPQIAQQPNRDHPCAS